MYNTSKFNLQPFNITSVDIDDVSDTAHIAAAVYSAVYRGGNSYDEIDISAAASVSVAPAAATFASASWAATAHYDVALRVDAVESDSAAAGFSCTLKMILNAFDELFIAPETHSKAEIGLNEMEADVIAARLAQDSFLSFNYPSAAIEISAIVDSQITSILFNVTSAEYEITIPPGSTLVIDSNNYVVLLDGENVIWCQSGDWLFLNRNTYDIVLDFVGGQSTTQKILYTERWL